MNNFTTANGGSFQLQQALKGPPAQRGWLWRLFRYIFGATLALALLWPAPAQAESVDKAAHFGVSYALQTWSYGFSRKGLRLPRTQAHVFAFALTAFAGLAWEVAGSGRPDPADVLANTLGSGAAMLTIEMFDF